MNYRKACVYAGLCLLPRQGVCGPEWLCLAAGMVILPCKAFLTNRQTLAALTVMALDVPHMMPAPPSGPWWSSPWERQQDRPSCGA